MDDSKKYYLHRISHEDYVSYSLLEKGYITAGWSLFSDTDILDASREEGYPRFEGIVKDKGYEKDRSRWVMWYFAQMKVGDTVIVPLNGGKYSAYKVIEEAKPISQLENEVPSLTVAWGENTVVWKNHMIFDQTENEGVDLGFYIKAEPILEGASRHDHALGAFARRMKMLQTNADITDIKDEIDRSIQSGIKKKPISIRSSLEKALTESIKNLLYNDLDDNKFELLVKWYMKKCGATFADKLAKNEPGKSGGADADIRACFDPLKYIVYIQAKQHRAETSDWAVKQIDLYHNQKVEDSQRDEGCTYAFWVISLCDDFSEEARRLAREQNIRLIDGNEFAQMLLDVGISGIDDAF